MNQSKTGTKQRPAVAGQNWSEILLYLFENEIVIDTVGRGWISSSSDVVKETGLEPEQVVSELHYLEDENLVEYTEVGGLEDFVVYRLTADGFKVAQERSKAQRERRQEAAQIDINRRLLHATLVLAATGGMQVIANILSAKPGIQELLSWSFGFLLLVILIGMVVETEDIQLRFNY